MAGSGLELEEGLSIDKKKLMTLRNKMRASPANFFQLTSNSRFQAIDLVRTAVLNLLLAVVSEK